jgi:hypothetical protein
VGLYAVSGVAATLLHSMVFPSSNVPLIGASGAIAGLMGAFMIRHFKTKVRFAYFFWMLLFRPLFGTFSVYAAVAFPIWFLIQVVGAGWSSPVGTAYYAHIGGFVFGALVGVSMHVFGWEQRYIAPMVEDSFEKLKVSYTMKEANRKFEAGDVPAAIPLFLAAIQDEPDNADAPLTLARLYQQQNKIKDSTDMYARALTIALTREDKGLAQSISEEMAEQGIGEAIDESSRFRLAVLCDKTGDFETAVRLYDSYGRLFPEGRFRPKALLRIHQIQKDKLNHPDLAQQALEKLKAEYPDWT